ncbi:MAG: metal-dependent hydrolase [Anaerolineae bacterium]|nr:metal-dependent hydrolase [Anaerolineae bacterium]
MGIKFQWLGHSAFDMHIDGHSVVFDPFLTGNPLAATTPEMLSPELILLSHAHGDHLGDTVAIAQASGAPVVANVEISKWLFEHGVKNAQGQNSGGLGDYGFVTVKLTIAFHSSSFPDGSYGGNPNGFIVTARESGQRLYFAGDTALFSDMALIGDERIDVAFLPIGDYYTMGTADSIRAIKYIRPRFVVPMHYNTAPPISQDASGWANRVSNETSAVPIVLDPGGEFSVPRVV